MLSRPTARLALLSFLALYLELCLVRWTTGYVRHFGLFTNFVVLASFLGMGCGLLAARSKTRIFLFFPLMLLLLVVLVDRSGFEVGRIQDPDLLQWAEGDASAADNSVMRHLWLVPVLFTMIAMIFATLCEPMGRLFSELPPLRAYAMNLTGSLAGSVLFTVNSFLLPTPVAWFAIVCVGALPLLLLAPGSRIVHAANIAALGGVLALVVGMNQGSMWSPYYRHEIWPAGTGYRLAANGIAGISLRDRACQAGLYRVSYGLRRVHDACLYGVHYGDGGLVRARAFDDVLIIGSGGGNEIDVALEHGARSVDAVEIDSWTVWAARTFHPDHPYDSPKVTTHVDDGRAYLATSDKKFDLVVYGLPDSTGLVSGHANMRVESYLFTVEAFRSVRRHLKKDGVFVLYNYYREPWLVAKLAEMLKMAFDEEPIVFEFDGSVAPATLIAGPGAHSLANGPSSDLRHAEVLPLATDDWPFLYLKFRRVPAVYLEAIFGALVISVVFAFGLLRRSGAVRLDGRLFFMGAAFMLLEAKSIVTFGLLFGTTWLTTALAMSAILFFALVAVVVNHRWQIDRLSPWIALLFVAIAMNYAAPPELLLVDNPTFRWVLASALAFSPVFLANVIFANLFRNAVESSASLASNVLGAIVGGVAEYASLVFGYRSLLLLVAAFYALAFLVPRNVIPPSLAKVD